jgi:hypothetical protein
MEGAMVTGYTVFDCEAGDEGAGAVSGPSLEQAARMLLERSGRIHEIRREGHAAVLFFSDADGALAGTDVVSLSVEPAESRREIYARVVAGEPPLLPGPFIAVPDLEYRRQPARAAYEVDDLEAELLARFGTATTAACSTRPTGASPSTSRLAAFSNG